jgi:hypothetical protein
MVALLKSFHITSDVMMIRSAAGEPGFFFLISLLKQGQ